MLDTPALCAACGATLPDGALSCPGCKQLVHAATLDAIAKRAQELEAKGDVAASAEVWQRALRLLPADSDQATVVRGRMASLQTAVRVSGASAAREKPAWVRRLGPFGVALAFLWKFKAVALVALSKAKFLVFGLAKLKTLLSMFLTMGVYWSLYGWKFAAGFVLGIYVHEMGHVWMLKHYGLRASAPMFIPGFGAFVSLYDSPQSAGQDARIGLAGPLWGAAAALACLPPAALLGSGVWFAIAHATAYINLFNLTPVWQLDGGRAFRALDRKQRLILLALIAGLWFVTSQGMFIILALGAAWRAFAQRDFAPEPDPGVLAQYAGLLVLFGAILALIPLQGL